MEAFCSPFTYSTILIECLWLKIMLLFFPEMFTRLNDSRIIIMFMNSLMVTASFQFRSKVSCSQTKL